MLGKCDGEGEATGGGEAGMLTLKAWAMCRGARGGWYLTLVVHGGREKIAPGVYTFTAKDYIDVFKDKGISCVVRLNEPEVHASRWMS